LKNSVLGIGEGNGGREQEPEQEQRPGQERKQRQEKGVEYGDGKDKNTEVLHRLSATRVADEALNKIVERVNEGFNGGRVSRMQALSWLLIRQADSLSDTTIQEIRSEFFDEIALLESLLREAKTTGKVPQEFRGLLQKHLGVEILPKKSKNK
jgi:hypothetical protein